MSIKKSPKKKVKVPRVLRELSEGVAYQKRLDLVLKLTLSTAALELAKGEYIELAPLPGVFGPFKLTGNSLPTFEYRVFDPRKKPFMMEFVKVRVEVSRPDRIQYIAHIDSEGSIDASRHGLEVPVLDKYREPFEKLASQLAIYFPYYRQPQHQRDAMRFDKVKRSGPRNGLMSEER